MKLERYLYAYNMLVEYERNLKEARYVYLVESSLHRMKQPTYIWGVHPAFGEC
jgi:hypothetical protein